MKRNFKRTLAAVLSVCVLATLLPLGTGVLAAQPLSRPDDPVIVSGADVAALSGVLPADLVAFRYAGGSWQQVPVQVDERKVVSYGKDVYNGVRGGYVTASYDKFENLVYCDTSTYVGADTNPYIDADDEIVFMARDTGALAPTEVWPDGVKQIRCVELTVTDPLAADSAGYIYLFERAADSGLSGDAGKPYVSYTFKLQSGKSYKEEFPFTKAKNAAAVGRPEDSSIITANYTYHFEDRWADDGLTITAGGATGVDILDRNKVAVMPSTQVPALVSGQISGGSRTENTFNGYTTDPAEGAFICNISGPVRAIRSYVGANSGPITQRDYYAYASRMDTVTYLRVHAMPSLMSFMDYSPAAAGMTYYRTDTPNGVTVDGQPDNLQTGAFSETELLTGAQGSLSITTAVTHNLTSGVSFNSYYLDSTAPSDEQYTGDAYAYASSGVWLSGNFTSMIVHYLMNQDLEAAAEAYGISNTDPVRSSSAKSLTVTKAHYFRAPGMTFAEAQADTQNVKTPLVYTAREIISANVQSWGVSYNANGATAGSVPTDENVYLEGSVLTLPGNTGGLARPGYKFAGWATSPDATQPLAHCAVGNAPLVLYAVWQRVADYSENGMSFIGGAPASLFEDAFDYADGTTSSDIVNSGKWQSRAEATTDGAFSKVINGKMVFQGRKSSSSGPKLSFDIDPAVVAGGSVVTLSCVMRTGTTGRTSINLQDHGASDAALVSQMVTLQNGTAKTSNSAGVTTSYTPGTTYDAAAGDLVPVAIVMDFSNKKYSVYANGKALLENENIPDWNTEKNSVRVQFEGSYSASATGYNWGELDDVHLRYAGTALSEVVVAQNGVTLEKLPKSGTIEVARSVRNEGTTAFSALMFVGVYGQNGALKQLKILPVNAPARTMAQLQTQITLDGSEAYLQVFMWKNLLTMQPITNSYRF